MNTREQVQTIRWPRVENIGPRWEMADRPVVLYPVPRGAEDAWQLIARARTQLARAIGNYERLARCGETEMTAAEVYEFEGSLHDAILHNALVIGFERAQLVMLRQWLAKRRQTSRKAA